MFDYSIDDTLKQIYYSTSDTNSTPNYEYLKFDQYQIRAVYKQKIEKSGFYYSFISNCGGYSDSIRIEYNMTNPGNEHLSLDTIPNKLTCLIFFILWVLVFFISLICMVRKCCHSLKVNLISILIIITYFFIMAYCITKYFYWKELSRRGAVSEAYEICFIMVESIINGLYLIIISVIAYGYQIVTQRIQCSKFIKNLIISGFILLSYTLISFSNFVVMIMMALEIVGLILFLNRDIIENITKLRKIYAIQMRLHREEDQYISELKSKIKYYRVFMMYLYVYWILECIVLLARPFLIYTNEWIFTLMSQILTLISMSFLFITINYSIEYIDDDSIIEALNSPDPFNLNEEFKTSDDFVIIYNFCEKVGRSENDFPSISLGVECSFTEENKSVGVRDPIKGKDRINCYIIQDQVEKANNNLRQLDPDSKNGNRNLSLKEEQKDINFDIEIDKVDCNHIKLSPKPSIQSPIFKSKKCLDFSSNMQRCSKIIKEANLEDTTDKNQPPLEEMSSVNKGRNNQVYFQKAVEFSSKIAKMTSKHLIDCVQEPIQLFKNEKNQRDNYCELMENRTAIIDQERNQNENEI